MSIRKQVRSSIEQECEEEVKEPANHKNNEYNHTRNQVSWVLQCITNVTDKCVERTVKDRTPKDMCLPMSDASVKEVRMVRFFPRWPFISIRTCSCKGLSSAPKHISINQV